MARASARLEFRLQLAGTEEAFIRNYQQLQQHQSATAPDAAAPDPMAAAQPATARRSPSVDQIHQALLNLYGGVALDNRDVSDVWIEAAPKGSAPASAPASPAPSSSAAQSRKPEAMPVTLMVKFTQSGSQKFAQATQLLAGTGLTLGIFVDGHLVSAPVVAADYAETGVTGGLASITGTFTPQQTETLITQIKSAK
jgi:preprotein translocase subunit SecD